MIALSRTTAQAAALREDVTAKLHGNKNARMIAPRTDAKSLKTFSTKNSPRGSSSKRSVRVALVEDQPAVRQNLARLINTFPDFTCVCTCANGEEAARVIPEIQPDVVLMDIFLPRMSGIECTARLKASVPRTHVIILTAMDDQELVIMAFEGGADGYLLKKTKPAELRKALLTVLAGGAPMTNQIAQGVIEFFRRKTTSPDKSPRLSIREEQVLRLLTRGYSNRQIAGQLKLSIDTVCSHLKHIYGKLQVKTRVGAVMHYLASKSEKLGAS